MSSRPTASIPLPISKGGTKCITFIVNPISGAGNGQQRLSQLLRKHLDKERFKAEVVYTEYAGHAVELARQAKERGADVVAAVGGDGSVNEVASALIHSDTALAVLPSGSGNGFSMHIGMGRKLGEAIRRLNETQIHTIDTAILNGKPFVSLSGLGFAAAIATRFQSSKRRGFLNYLFITLKSSWKVPFHKYEVSVDGRPFRKCECLMLEVANSSNFGYDFKPAPQASLGDGLLDLVLVHKAPVYKYFLSFPRMVTSNIHKASFMEYERGKHIRVRIPNDSFMHMDGEGRKWRNEDGLLLDYKVMPASLKVLAPEHVTNM